jgi:hypothetical protein
MIERIKDWIYDSSDLFAAIIIIVFAAFIITGRIDKIMSFPDSYSATASQQSSAAVIHTGNATTSSIDMSTPKTGTANTTTKGSIPSKSTQNTTDSSMTSANTPPQGTSIKITIPSGATGDKIAQILKESGLIAQTSDFLNAVTNSSAESKLRSGTFTIPSGSTPDKIVQILIGK